VYKKKDGLFDKD
jgi:hypothetical protein